MARARRWTDTALRDAVAASSSMAGVLRLLGIVAAGGNYASIKSAIRRLGLDTSHWSGHGWRRGRSTPGSPKKRLDEILVQNSDYLNRHSLKRRLLATNLLSYACAECGISAWRDRPLPLDLDHVSGDVTDNRIENLRLLCPNCHSQTATYRGRNIGKIRWRVSEWPGWRNWQPREA